MENLALIISDPFIPVKTEYPVSKATKKNDQNLYIFSYELKDVVKKTGDKEDDFVIEHKVVMTSKIDRQEYIDSFSDDVGILNILKKVSLTGDFNLLNQRVRETLPVDEYGREQVVDISGVGDQETAKNMVLSMNKMLAGLDPQLREAILTMNEDELKSFLAGYNKSKDDNKDGE